MDRSSTLVLVLGGQDERELIAQATALARAHQRADQGALALLGVALQRPKNERAALLAEAVDLILSAPSSTHAITRFATRGLRAMPHTRTFRAINAVL